MNRAWLVVVVLLVGSAAFADNREIPWSETEAHGGAMSGEVVNRHGVKMLKLSNRTDEELRLPIFSYELARYDQRDIQSSYAISGEVEYEGVEGHAYLEMLSYFPPPNSGPYFSRTLSPSGVNGWITGTGRKKFEVPFYLSEGDPKPIKLDFNVVLPSRGTIYLGPFKMINSELRSPFEESMRLERTGRSMGAILGGFGALLGILGGLVGTLAGMGKARTLVLGTMKLLIGLGILFFVVGLALLVTHQQWTLYVPLFFMGLLLLAIMAPLLPVVRMRYDQLELRRITAQDAGG